MDELLISEINNDAKNIILQNIHEENIARLNIKKFGES